MYHQAAAAVQPAHVYVPGELERRPATATDPLQEKIALQELAARLIDAPGEVLPKFVELAMDLAGGISAGLSLYEDVPGTAGIFRWHHLCGVLEPFNGATTPRNDSPCGVTLDRRTPVLAIHAERMYEWIADANIVVPEVLLVPLYVGALEPLGTLWIVSDQVGHFNGSHARAMTELASFVGIALKLQKNELELRKSLAEQETLTREMNHRVQNLFAMFQSIVTASARNAATPKEMAQTASGRMLALSSAHSLVRHGLGDHIGPRVADLGALVETIIRPHEASPKTRPRFVVEGIAIGCGDRAINGLALLLHELTTNAVKHGALSVDTGEVSIRWTVSDETLVLTWSERGGPEIAPPQRRGFGTALARSTIEGLQGASSYDWRREGLSVTFEIPRASLAH